MKFKVLTTCENEIFAQECCNLLKQNNISFNLEKSNDIAIFPSTESCTIKILVPISEYNLATKIYTNPLRDRNKDIVWCPNCGGEDCSFSEISHQHGPYWLLILCTIVSIITIVLVGGIALIILSLFIFWFIPYTERYYTCKKCENKFRKH